MRRRQFEAYLDKVFDWSTRVTALPEGRQYPRHPWTQVFDGLFLGGAIQIPNVHRLEAECARGVLKQRVGKLSESTMGYALQRQDPASIFALGCEVAQRLKRNGVLHSHWARGRLVAAVDGIEICSSLVRCCDTCMEREIEHKVEGQARKDIQYYHRLVAVVLVSADFPVPLGIRFQQNGEDEVACALALLQELDRRLGRRFLDVLVADALYLRKGFVEAIEKLKLEWVFTLKDNQPELLAEAQRVTADLAPVEGSTGGDQFDLWHAPEVYWPAADRGLRVVKICHRQTQHRVELTPAGTPKKEKRTRQAVQEESTNYYASKLELGSVPPAFIHQLGRSRWRIDSEAFQTLTTQAHLKQPSVHQSVALVVLTMIRVLAYTLSTVFYHRQVVSHARQTPPAFSEMARLLAYLFLTPGLDSS